MKINIRKLRVDLGLPQTEFGQLLGVHSMTVSRWERGELAPTPYQQALMAEFGKAAEKRNVSEELKSLLLAAGIVAAIYFLLTQARK